MIQDVTNRLLVIGMDMQVTKQTVVALNVANVQNKGAKAVSVSFKQQLEKLSAAQDKESLQQKVLQIDNVSSTADFKEQDVGSIDLGAETQNSLQAESRYKTMVELMNKRLGMLSMGIKGNK